MGINIRPVIPKDFEAVYRFICNLEEAIFDRDELKTCFDACLSLPHHHYLIAEIDGYAVGYVSCHGQLLLHHCGMVYEIEELYVDYAHRNLGIGALLIAAVENALAGSGHKLLEVASGLQRTDAHRFYKENGFRQTSYKFVKEPIDTTASKP
jgi:PhnO protein